MKEILKTFHGFKDFDLRDFFEFRLLHFPLLSVKSDLMISNSLDFFITRVLLVCCISTLNSEKKKKLVRTLVDS